MAYAYALGFPRDVTDCIYEMRDFRFKMAGDGGKERKNCEFLTVYLHGFPAICMQACKPIPRGTELLVDYGSGYWARIKREQCFHQAKEYAEQGCFRNFKRQVAGVLSRVDLSDA